MIEWNDYLANLLSADKEFESLTFSLENSCSTSSIPPIVKASVIMLEKMIEKQGKRNVVVFPDNQSISIFILMMLFHNIYSGKIKSNYNPTNFSVGERLKVGNAVVEYLGAEIREGNQCIIIKLADCISSAPMKYLPIFQKANTNRRLSKYKQYFESKELASKGIDLSTKNTHAYLINVAKMKTHMDSSIFAMTSVAGAKEQVSTCRICGKKVTDIFFVGQCDYKGNISNIGPGQLAGIPAIVFASDLYSINEAAENHKPIQSIIIDGSNAGWLNQLDALDGLLNLEVPVVCITDVVNSFELEQLSIRGFNIWRWDSDSITDQLYGTTPLSSDQKIRNCAKQNVQYLKITGDEISDVMQSLAKYRKEIETQSIQLMKLFEKLNSLTFAALRATVPFFDVELNLAQQTLTECDAILQKECSYIDKVTYMDYANAITVLKKIYSAKYILQKVEVIKRYLQEHNIPKVYLVVPEKASKPRIQNFWTNWCLQHFVKTKIIVILPSEYYAVSTTDVDTTIICGWMKRAIMRKIIFSYNTSQYIVMLYEYENRWKNYDARKWTKALDNTGNKRIIEKSFSSDLLEVSTIKYEKTTPAAKTEDNSDELGEIELVLRENKFRQYVNGGIHSGSELVSAIPVSFVGGYLAFYRTGHKVVSVTKIILADFEKIESKLPYELQTGDFIVVREADKDLIKEIADVALSNSGKIEMRELATKWREALEIELLFTTLEDFYEKLKNAGCDKGLPTVRRWIEDEDVISPHSKNDLQLIAEVTQNEMLLELLDKIFDAAQEVRKAHVLAGRKLSDQLKQTLAAELKNYGEIDPFNFWEPINIEIDGIGNVKVLKIIDIGSEIEISSADTNRLIEE